jgi:hypothetical protein
MNELIGVKQAAEEAGIAESLANAYIGAARLKSQKLVIGKDSVLLFDRTEAINAINARVREEREIHAANVARLEAAKVPTLKDVMAAVKSIAVDVADVAEMDSELKRLTGANKILFDVLKEFKANTQDQIAGLKNIIVNMRDELKSQKDTEKKQEIRKVAVIGIGTIHHAALMAEFQSLISLKLLDKGDIRALHGLRGYDKAFVMKKTTDHGHLSQLKAVKVPVHMVDGSLEELKEELLTYCTYCAA